jgi:hypothetical protein
MLLHARFHDDLDAASVRRVLTGYRNRYALIRDALVEARGEFADEDLTRMHVLELLTQPVLVVAQKLAGQLAAG